MNWNQVIGNKVVSLETAQNIRSQWKDQKVVFTNGCFDIIHQGHLDYLAQSADHGSKLIVALNSDSSVKELKGPKRPILDQETRAIKMASFQFVDLVIIFSDPTPIDLILGLKPDVLTKGGDYALDEIVGAKEVLSWNGKVEIISFREGHSSSSIIAKIKGPSQ